MAHRVSKLAYTAPRIHFSHVMPKVLQALELTLADRRLLESWVRAGTTPQRVARRARIILHAADGFPSRTISQRLSVSPHTVDLWRERFSKGGPKSLQRDAPGRGRRPAYATEPIEWLLRLLRTPREDGRRWTVRLLAEATGLSRASVHRLLRKHSERNR
jgi:transposase